MKVLVFVLSVLFFLQIFRTSAKVLEIKMIADVLESFQKPSNVIAYLCWTSSMKKTLMVKLSELNEPKTVKFSTHFKDATTAEKIIFLTDVSCPEVSSVLERANTSNKFTKPYRWILVGNNASENALTELNNSHILPDSEVYVTRPSENDRIKINLVYKIKQHLGWIVENYGVWSVDVGLIRSKYTMDVTAPMRRKNLSRETIVSSIVINDNSTLADLEILRYPQIDPVTKSAYHQLSALYDFTNATRRLITTDAWGYRINGSWTGILGDLAQGKAELPGTIMFITKERMEVVDYLSHPTALTVRFIFREPPLSYQNNLYLLPFKVQVWYSLGVFVIILIISLYINAYWEVTKRRSREEGGDTSVLVPNISDVTVFVMSAISQQGNTVELKGSLGRFVTLILLLVCLFLYTAYSASIVVLLQASSSQIRTLTDLLHSKLELGVEDTPYNRYWFAVSVT